MSNRAIKRSHLQHPVCIVSVVEGFTNEQLGQFNTLIYEHVLLMSNLTHLGSVWLLKFFFSSVGFIFQSNRGVSWVP
jgi:hypothetical protein